MKNYLEDRIIRSLEQFDTLDETPDISLEKPKMADHGDLSCNVAMLLAKPLSKPPRQIAEAIVAKLDVNPKIISAVEIAGPGFINFRFAEEWVYNELRAIHIHKDDFGKNDAFADKTVLIEFVSANPTGPLTVGHGRNAVLGDTVARLYEWSGANVEREYYFNDGGRQMRLLGESVASRYFQIQGQDFDLPDGGYEGEYIKDIAKTVLDEMGKDLTVPKETEVFKSAAKKAIFADIEQTLRRMNIEMTSYFNELDLYQNGENDAVISELTKLGFVEKRDGATWFLTSKLGKEKDTVLVKSTGEPTYRLPDIAYHKNKLERGFDICIDVFGADHIATFPDVVAAIKLLGYDESRIDVMIYQFVTLIKDGKPFKMSTRKANFVTLDELMDEVGSDVTRFFFLMRTPGTHLEFDLDQAKEASDKNPVFYLQYAHARIKSILRKAHEESLVPATNNLKLLAHDSEVSLAKKILDFPETIASAANAKEPHRLINYLNDVAADFHRFYHNCRILGEEKNLAESRLLLCEVAASVLFNGLGILGISAPDKM